MFLINWVFLGLMLLAIVALIKERRLRFALQDILKRLIEHWRSNANKQSVYPNRGVDDGDDDRVWRK